MIAGPQRGVRCRRQPHNIMFDIIVSCFSLAVFACMLEGVSRMVMPAGFIVPLLMHCAVSAWLTDFEATITCCGAGSSPLLSS